MSGEIHLEPSLKDTPDGTLVDCVVRPIWHGSSFTLVETLIHKQLVRIQTMIPKQQRVTLFHFRKQKEDGFVVLEQTQQSVIIGHQPWTQSTLRTHVETCSGLGAVTTGYQKCGVNTVAFNDENAAFAQCLERHGKVVVRGNINDVKTVAQLATFHASILSAGVSCQPFSTLGDMHEQHDERSQSLTGTLKAGYLMQTAAILIECTPRVQQSPWAQKVLQSFSEQTGFKVHQQVLDLHTFWVSRRTRWWCTITHPSLQAGEIPQIPPLMFQPCLIHLFPMYMQLEDPQMQQLALDMYELRHFHDGPGIGKHFVDAYKALPTATHSWGSQVKTCECGCRKAGFSEERLKEKGLYGQVVSLGRTTVKYGFTYHHCRHLHASEVALANGLDPFYVGLKTERCRLELSGVGQLASPFQGAWVMANLIKDVHVKVMPMMNFVEPLDLLRNMALQLLEQRDRLFVGASPTKYMAMFQHAVAQWGDPQPIPFPLYTEDEKQNEQKTSVPASLNSDALVDKDENKLASDQLQKKCEAEPRLHPRQGVGVGTEEHDPATSVQSEAGMEAIASEPFVHPRQGLGHVAHLHMHVNTSKSGTEQAVSSFEQGVHPRQGLGHEHAMHTHGKEQPPEPDQRKTSHVEPLQHPKREVGSAKGPERVLHPRQGLGHAAITHAHAEDSQDATEYTRAAANPGLHPRQGVGVGTEEHGPATSVQSGAGMEAIASEPFVHPRQGLGHVAHLHMHVNTSKSGTEQAVSSFEQGVHPRQGLGHEHAMHTHGKEQPPEPDQRKTSHVEPLQHPKREVGSAKGPERVLHPRQGLGHAAITHAHAEESQDATEYTRAAANPGLHPRREVGVGNIHVQDAPVTSEATKASSASDQGLHPRREIEVAANMPVQANGMQSITEKAPSPPDAMVQQVPPGILATPGQHNASASKFSQDPGISSEDSLSAAKLHQSQETTAPGILATPGYNNASESPGLTQPKMRAGNQGKATSPIETSKQMPLDCIHDEVGCFPVRSRQPSKRKEISATHQNSHSKQLNEVKLTALPHGKNMNSEGSLSKPMQEGKPPEDNASEKSLFDQEDDEFEAHVLKHFAEEASSNQDNTNDNPGQKRQVEPLTQRNVRPRTEQFAMVQNQDGQPEPEANLLFVIKHGEPIHHFVQSSPHTAAQLAQAHQKLVGGTENVRISTPMGTQIPLNEALQPGHYVHLQSAETFHLHKCPMTHDGKCPVLQGQTREELLWRQFGWVAVDEMSFYMHAVECSHPGTTLQMQEVPATSQRDVQITGHILAALKIAGQDLNSNVKVFTVLYDSHWIPILVKAIPNEPQVWIPQQEKWIQESVLNTLGQTFIHFHVSPMPHAFVADCGFQAIGWIISLLMDEETTQPFTVRQACQWRSLFQNHLLDNDKAKFMIRSPLRLGGMQNTKEQLQALVTNHGVAQSRAKECTEQIINVLGLQAVQQALASPKPWADLKAKANLQQPPLKIVLASELQEMIKARTQNDKAVGSKHNKAKKTPNKKPTIRVSAEQLNIPKAVFKQQDGVELPQIQASQIGPTSGGIVLMNIAEAVPYFGLNTPVSTEGVALLVLDYEDERIPQPKQLVKIPAQCVATQEPMLVTVAILQIGQKQVVRNIPSQCIQIQETPNEVVRILVYRDQLQQNWESFCTRPVKHLLTTEPFASIPTSEVLDVWDRQFLSYRLTKVPAQEAQMFAVNLRVTQSVASQMYEGNATDGKYIEPRSSDGRSPSDAFQVTWIPRKTFAEVQIMHRATTTPTMVVRQGERYGLRTENQYAEEMHAKYRPDIVYLPGTELKRFTIGPMPFGTTKQSLTKVFSQWNWQARPTGPQGQSQDRSGLMWGVHAANDPSHWVFHMAHGDILITPEDKQQFTVKAKSTVQASAKTMTSLMMASTTQPKDDPWLDPHRDPWQSAKPSKELSVGQVTALEASLEKKLLHKLRNEDEQMDQEVEHRVTALETRIDQLQQQLSSHQHEQASQNAAMQTQLQQLDQKVDHQQQSLNSMLDGKLELQMQRIEQLFSKRPRVGD